MNSALSHICTRILCKVKKSQIGFESLKKLTRFVSESVVKENTNYRRAIGFEKRVALCIQCDKYAEICLLKTSNS
jgi:hypothetical protein